MTTLTQLKTSLGITGTAQDAILTAYLDFIQSYLENELGVDLVLSGTTITKSFKQSYMMSKVFPVEAWTNITKIEIAKKSPTLTWKELANYNQVEILDNLNISGVISQIKSLTADFSNSILRITGAYGFGTNLPVQINELITKTAQSYLDFTNNQGAVVKSENSSKLSITLDFSNVLSGLGVLDPKSNPNLAKIIKTYSCKFKYPYL
jgi:Phage gp6-like head-tail connector protein